MRRKLRFLIPVAIVLLSVVTLQGCGEDVEPMRFDELELQVINPDIFNPRFDGPGDEQDTITPPPPPNGGGN